MLLVIVLYASRIEIQLLHYILLYLSLNVVIEWLKSSLLLSCSGFAFELVLLKSTVTIVCFKFLVVIHRNLYVKLYFFFSML